MATGFSASSISEVVHFCALGFCMCLLSSCNLSQASASSVLKAGTKEPFAIFAAFPPFVRWQVASRKSKATVYIVRELSSISIFLNTL